MAAAAAPAAGTARESLIALLAANGVALVLALLGYLRAADVLLLYWVESAVVGIYNVLRMALARGEKGPQPPRLFIIPFFAVHYGVFMTVHLVFIGVISSLIEQGGMANVEPFAIAGTIASWEVLVPVAALFGSHGVSFYRNFIGRGEYRRTGRVELMFRPYGRIVLMHLTLLGGGFAYSAMPWLPSFLLIVPKVAVDAWAHLRERRALSGTTEDTE